MAAKLCSQCKQPFDCHSAMATQPCWCTEFPALLPVDGKLDCFCPDCLTMAMASEIDALMASHTFAEMLAIAKPYYSANKLIAGIDYDVEQGRYVFSSWYHLKRGYCCGNGCRHCPYGELVQ